MANAKTVALVLRRPTWHDELPMRGQAEIGGHLGMMVRLSREGVIEAAGPFFRPEEPLEGDAISLVVFAEADIETAERALEADPARAAGTITSEVHPWHR